MKTFFTIETIKQSACAGLNPNLLIAPKKPKIKKPRNDCPEVQYIHWQLKYWAIEKGYKLEKEYRFCKRRFRFDFALPEFKISVEYDGINSKKSSHTTLLGFTKDTEKINMAISLGWKVLRYTAINYKSIIQDLEKILK